MFYSNICGLKWKDMISISAKHKENVFKKFNNYEIEKKNSYKF